MRGGGIGRKTTSPKVTKAKKERKQEKKCSRMESKTADGSHALSQKSIMVVDHAEGGTSCVEYLDELIAATAGENAFMTVTLSR